MAEQIWFFLRFEDACIKDVSENIFLPKYDSFFFWIDLQSFNPIKVYILKPHLCNKFFLQGVHQILGFFLKILWFFLTLPVLLQRWCSTCRVCVHTLTGKTEKDQSLEYSKICGKNTIFNEHPVYHSISSSIFWDTDYLHKQPLPPLPKSFRSSLALSLFNSVTPPNIGMSFWPCYLSQISLRYLSPPPQRSRTIRGRKTAIIELIKRWKNVLQ